MHHVVRILCVDVFVTMVETPTKNEDEFLYIEMITRLISMPVSLFKSTSISALLVFPSR